MKGLLISIVILGMTGGAYATSALEQLSTASGDVGHKLVAPEATKTGKTAQDILFDKLGLTAEKGSSMGLEGDTPVEILKRLFEQGTPATKEDLIGIFSGRIIYLKHAWAANVLQGSLFACSESPLIYNGGPLFDAPKKVLVTILDAPLPHYYDNMSVQTAKQNIVAWYEDPYVMQFPSAKGESVNATYRPVLEVRKAGNYIVQHSIKYDRNMSRVESEGYGYYFKKIAQ